MELIAMESEVFQQLKAEINEIKQKLDDFKKKSETPLSEKWLDNSEVCQILNISKRLLQNYRDKKILPFTRIGGKIYYKAVDLDALLIKHYNA